MADNDKIVAFETAINLMREAQEQLSEAAELFHKCGIELCGIFSWSDPAKKWCNFTNTQIYKGIKEFEKLSGTHGYFINDDITGKEDKSSRYVEYNGLRFVQVMHDKQ